MKHLIPLMVLLGAALPVLSADVTSALEAGKTFANSNYATGSSLITSTDTSKIPGYTSNPPQAASYGTGVSLFSLGSTKINTCAGYTPGSDKVANQECDAVNFLAKNPYERVIFDISRSDPIFTEPDLQPGLDFINGTGSEDCVPTTVQNPSSERQEICHEYEDESPKTCTIGRVVEVDADTNYLCNQTINAYETVTCNRNVIASIAFQCGTGGATYPSLDSCRAGCNPEMVTMWSIQWLSGQWHNIYTTEYSVAAPYISSWGLGNSYTIDGTNVTWVGTNGVPVSWSLAEYDAATRLQLIQFFCNSVYTPTQILNAGGTIRVNTTTSAMQSDKFVVACTMSAPSTCNSVVSTTVDNQCAALESRSF